MKNSHMERWEQWPVGGLVFAGGLNTAIWYTGKMLPLEVRDWLPWIVTTAAVAAVVAIDGSLVATIGGMREGRRSIWSTANIIVTALFTGLAALAAHEVLPWIGPSLHGLFAITLVTYSMHLAQPKNDLHEAQRAANGALSDDNQEYQNGHHGALEDTTEALIVDGPVTYRAKCRKCGQRHTSLQAYRNCPGIPAANTSD